MGSKHLRRLRRALIVLAVATTAPAAADQPAPVVGCNPDGCLFDAPDGVIHDGFRFQASSAPGTGSYGWWEHFTEQPPGTYVVVQLCSGPALTQHREFTDSECGPPSPVYQVPRPATVPDIIRRAFLDAGATAATADFAVRVAHCESRLNPRATNGQYLGLFQLGHYHYWRFGGAPWSDPWVNARAAAGLWADSGWGPWECA